MTKLEDVARQAGVSAATVSRAINAPERVRAGTRARVEEAIQRLGYRPSRVARRLRVRGGGSGLLGLVIPDLQNPFFADLARGVEDMAQRRGYTVLIGNADEDAGKESRYLEVMAAESVDGVLLPPTAAAAPGAEELVRAGIPVVCVDRYLPRWRVDRALVDNVRGTQEAVEHLLRLGHRRIGFIQGRPHLSTSQERRRGYLAALEEAGVAVAPELIRSGDSRQQSGAEIARELLSAPDRPSALLVGNSMMTLGTLEAIHALGLSIPDEIALIGYDDMPWAMAVTPPLTVVRQPGYELGARAAELLLQRICEPERSITVVMLQPELVVRRSCGAGTEPGGTDG